MTYNVYYTDRAQPDSSFVNRAWYDNTKSDLYVELHGSVYQYRNVPEFVFDELVAAESPGNYYSNYVKGRYHPGSRLGSISELREMRALPNVQDVTKAEVRTSEGFAPVVSLRNQPLVQAETPSLSLVKDVPTTVKSDARRYEFVFLLESDETDTERTHTVYAESEDAALDELFELADKFDQDFVPLSSTVYYD